MLIYRSGQESQSSDTAVAGAGTCMSRGRNRAVTTSSCQLMAQLQGSSPASWRRSTLRGEALPVTCCITGAPEHAVQVLDLLLSCDNGCFWLKALRVAEGICALYNCLLFWKLQGEATSLLSLSSPEQHLLLGHPLLKAPSPHEVCRAWHKRLPFYKSSMHLCRGDAGYRKCLALREVDSQRAQAYLSAYPTQTRVKTADHHTNGRQASSQL